MEHAEDFSELEVYQLAQTTCKGNLCHFKNISQRRNVFPYRSDPEIIEIYWGTDCGSVG